MGRGLPSVVTMRSSRQVQTIQTSLHEWATTVGIDMKSLSLSRSRDGPRGLVTEASRTVGEPLISVPASLALQVKSLDSKVSPFPNEVGSHVWEKLPWYSRLAIELLRARHGLGSNAGPLAPYLDLLPKKFDELPYHWTEDEMALLQDVRLSEMVRSQQILYRGQYDSILASTNTAWLSLEDYIWAVQCVRSRSFSGDLETTPFGDRLRLFGFVAALAVIGATSGTMTLSSAANGALTAVFALAMYDLLTPRIMGLVSGVRLKRYSLVPGVDFFNHASRVNGKAEVSYEYFTDKFVVNAGEDYKPDDEVAISYGAQSNDSLLQIYGFVEADNPADGYRFSDAIADMLGVSQGAVTARRDCGFNDSVIEQVAGRFNGDKEAACLTLVDLCRAELSGFPTTLDEDLSLSPNSTREGLALAYRIEKKKILHSAIVAMGHTFDS